MATVKRYLPLIAVLAVAVLLRFYHLTAISLWHDEAFSALLPGYGWSEMFYRIGLDVHPPVYYVLLKLWGQLFDLSLFSLRSFSAVFGVASVYMTWLLVRRAFSSERFALTAALLVAVNPFQAQYSPEARMYTLGGFIALAAAYSLVVALQNQRALSETGRIGAADGMLRGSRRAAAFGYLAFAVLAAAGALTHYYLLFTDVALALYGLVYAWRHFRGLRAYLPLGLSFLLSGALFLPWLKVFLFQLKQVGGGYWIPPINVWSVPETVWQLFVALPAGGAEQLQHRAYLAGSVALVLVLLWFLRRTQRTEKWLLVFCFLAPFAGALAFALLAHLTGSKSSVFLVRYFLFAAPFGTAIVAGWLSQMRFWRLATVLIVACAALGTYGVYRYWHVTDVPRRPGMAAASNFLAQNVEPNQPVVLGTSFMFFNYKFYNRTPSAPVLYSGGVTKASDISHFAGSALLTDRDLLPDMKTAGKKGGTVWLIWTYAFGSNKPSVPENWKQVLENEYPDVRPYLGTSVYVTEYKVQ